VFVPLAVARLEIAFYASNASLDQQALARTIADVQRLYRTNVFSHEGYVACLSRQPRAHDSDGCFRCHDGNHVARDGTAISADCSYCHDQS
jgi:hypothetical protein